MFLPLPFGEVDDTAGAIAAMVGTGMSTDPGHIFDSCAGICIKNGPETALQWVAGRSTLDSPTYSTQSLYRHTDFMLSVQNLHCPSNSQFLAVPSKIL